MVVYAPIDETNFSYTASVACYTKGPLPYLLRQSGHWKTVLHKVPDSFRNLDYAQAYQKVN